MSVRSHAQPTLPLCCFEIQWFSALQVLCQHDSSLLQDLSKASPQLSSQQIHVKIRLTTNAALCCQGTQVKHQTQRWNKMEAALQQEMDWLADCPCPAQASLPLCSPATQPLQHRSCGGCPGPSPHHCSSQCHSRARNLLLVHLLWCVYRQAVPAPLGTAEVCFYARKGAQICCHPRGAGKQQARNST